MNGGRGGRASSWSFHTEDSAAITEALRRFLENTGCKCAMLVDRSGQLIATVGDQPDFDPTAFASLTAADFSANDQLAKMLGETDFSTLFHQGEKESMYLADVARRVILVALFDNSTTLGMVRLKMKQTVEELTQLFDKVFSRGRDDGSGANSAGMDVLAGADDEIDQLFKS
jgi:predicted regulator of Ras-like GTPase activity (Roadblock/LC7/MglB family)